MYITTTMNNRSSAYETAINSKITTAFNHRNKKARKPLT